MAPTSTPAQPRAHDARAAGLRHSTDRRPGIRRRRVGRGFAYTGPDGEPIRDRATLDRIRTLAIPPAWTDVWICSAPNGHLQATGRDARGRKQHRYHPDYRAHREASKFDRLVAFARALPKIRAQVERDLRRPGLPREKVLAAVVRLLELTLIRVGNEEYARLNRSFGLTTLRDRHARIDGTGVRFRFKGKSGREHEVGLRDRRLAGIVRRCQELPGQELFQYLGEDGTPSSVASEDVNDYLRAAAGVETSAKDFRTWAGTVLAYRAMRTLPRPASERAARRTVAAVMRHTAGRLGNTPAVARSSYVHPALVDAYLDGQIRGTRKAADPAAGQDGAGPGADDTAPLPEPPSPQDEAALVRLLRAAVERDARRVVDRPRRREGQVNRRSSSR